MIDTFSFIRMGPIYREPVVQLFSHLTTIMWHNGHR